jgi:hypothetical protein
VRATCRPSAGSRDRASVVTKLELELAQVENTLGNVALLKGDIACALACADQSIARKERGGDQYGVGFGEDLRGRAHTWLGNFEAAELCLARATEIATEHGDARGQVAVLVHTLALEVRKLMVAAAQGVAVPSAGVAELCGRLSSLDPGPVQAQEVAIQRTLAAFILGEPRAFAEARAVLEPPAGPTAQRSRLLRAGLDCLTAADGATARELGRTQRRALDREGLLLDGIEWAHLRALAFARLGQPDELATEQRLFRRLRQRVGPTYLDGVRAAQDQALQTEES